jgi:transposase-like protein
MSVLSKPYFTDEAAAFEHVEATLWPEGPVCPHCGSVAAPYKLAGVRTKATKKNPEGSLRHGLYKCRDCRKQFTVRIGTIFEESHLPLHIWLQAIHLVCSSKKGISAHQLHRVLECTYKTAWFLEHRIREAMRLPLEDQGALGGNGKAVEVDETYVGGKESNKPIYKRTKARYASKAAVFSMVQRGGDVRSMHLTEVTAKTLRPIMLAHIDDKSALYTDDAGQYRKLSDDFAHEVVNHSAEEYVRGEVHTNTIEGYFSILKRGINGTYHHVSQQHLGRYLAEFDFRYNNRLSLGVEDQERAKQALVGVKGKRLTYRGPDRLETASQSSS